MVYIKAPSQHLLGGTEESLKTSQDSLWAETQTQDFLKMKEFYPLY
jgi:hypothetical protein